MPVPAYHTSNVRHFGITILTPPLCSAIMGKIAPVRAFPQLSVESPKHAAHPIGNIMLCKALSYAFEIVTH